MGKQNPLTLPPSFTWIEQIKIKNLRNHTALNIKCN